jgi:hypothetical protein
VTQTQEEGRLVSEDGLLQIDWPRLVESGAGVQLDILLATANAPTLSGDPLAYAAAQTIADAWNRAGDHVQYFWKNRDCGIHTSHDDDIRARLHPRTQGRV